jgi:predicted nucleotidyltransferase
MTLNRSPRERPLDAHHLIVSAKQLAEVQALLREYLPGLEVRAFGSRAGGHPKPASDLDLMVVSEKPVGPRTLALLADAFAESDLPFTVDLIDASTASASFRARALAGSIVVQPAASRA